jgi:hypothetical protein
MFAAFGSIIHQIDSCNFGRGWVGAMGKFSQPTPLPRLIIQAWVLSNAASGVAPALEGSGFELPVPVS